jgi:hypothetical protein
MHNYGAIDTKSTMFFLLGASEYDHEKMKVQPKWYYFQWPKHRITDDHHHGSKDLAKQYRLNNRTSRFDHCHGSKGLTKKI